jgi:hypothetical protein
LFAELFLQHLRKERRHSCRRFPNVPAAHIL